MSLRVGYIGQVKGPIDSGTDIITSEGIQMGAKIRFGVSVSPRDLMPIPDWYFKVNDRQINMGKTGMYETDEPIAVSSLVFPMAAPISTLIDFVVYE